MAGSVFGDVGFAVVGYAGAVAVGIARTLSPIITAKEAELCSGDCVGFVGEFITLGFGLFFDVMFNMFKIVHNFIL